MTPGWFFFFLRGKVYFQFIFKTRNLWLRRQGLSAYLLRRHIHLQTAQNDLKHKYMDRTGEKLGFFLGDSGVTCQDSRREFAKLSFLCSGRTFGCQCEEQRLPEALKLVYFIHISQLLP